MEGDPILEEFVNPAMHFNPLPPHGGRLDLSGDSLSEGTFQSTPSAWRETLSLVDREEVIAISIHSLRMEGDTSATA